MGLFSSKEEKAAIAKAKEEARLEAEAKRKKEQAESLIRQAEMRKKAEAEQKAREEKAAKEKRNKERSKSLTANSFDQGNYQAVIIEQNFQMIELLTNLAIMNSNIINNPMIAMSNDGAKSRMVKFHKDYEK